MTSRSSDMRFLFTSNTNAPSGPNPNAVLDLLDHFARGLQLKERSFDQIRLTIETLREGIDADVVYWHPGKDDSPLVQVGQPELSAEWCRRLTETLLWQTPGVGSQLLRTRMDSFPGTGERQPHSIAMVRVSLSRQSWIVALSFRQDRQFRPLDMSVMSLARRLLLTQRQHLRMQGVLKGNLLEVIRSLVGGIDARHPSTRGRSERVARIAVRIGEQMNLDSVTLGDLYLGALLHDIGLIGIPETLLEKSTALSANDALQMQQHTVIGDRLLSNISRLAHLRPCVRNHHEHYDGTGYPDGLAGEEIPLLARIVAIANAFEAILSDSTSRNMSSPERVEAGLTEGAGTRWDPVLVAQCLACRQQCLALYQVVPDEACSLRDADSWKHRTFALTGR